jgi:hypothetical protein
MMTAVLSCTADDLYSFNLPFAVYSWHKIGVNCLVLRPTDVYDGDNGAVFRLGFAMGWCTRVAPGTGFYTFVAPKDKIATYAQCARLYAAAINNLDTDILITSDADMCVFDQAYWDQFDLNAAVNLIGTDLVPPGQVPMCYIAAPLVGWRNIMEIGNRMLQQCLDDLLGSLEAEHFRGNYWAKDQETAYRQLENSPYPIVKHLRAKEGTQFATRRADRDGWSIPSDIIDAHLCRPGNTSANFAKIVELFRIKYPNDDLLWMHEYYNEFNALIGKNEDAARFTV